MDINKQNWKFNAPQFVDFRDESTFQDNEENDQFFLDAKENDLSFSPNNSSLSAFQTPSDKGFYDLRQTPLREIKNNGGTPYRETRASRLFGKRIGNISTKSFRSNAPLDVCDDLTMSSKRDTFDVSSIREVIFNIEKDTENASDDLKVSDSKSNVEDDQEDVQHINQTLTKQLTDFSEVDSSKFVEDYIGTSMNGSRRSSHNVRIPVTHRVTFNEDSQNITPTNESNFKKAILFRKATPMVRMSLNNSLTLTKGRNLNNKIEKIEETVLTPTSTPRVTFASTVTKRTEKELGKKTSIVDTKSKPTSNPTLVKNRPPLYQPKRVNYLLFSNKSTNSGVTKKSNLSVSANQDANTVNGDKRKRVYNIPSTRSAYNFMNSMRNYSPFIPVKNRKLPVTVAVGPKLMTGDRVGTRVQKSESSAPKPRFALTKPLSKTISKPLSSTHSIFVRTSNVILSKHGKVALPPKRPYGPMASKKILTKAVTPHFASDDRIKIWHSKHDEVDQSNSVAAFKAKPAPDFKKLHAKNKLAQYSSIKPAKS